MHTTQKLFIFENIMKRNPSNFICKNTTLTNDLQNMGHLVKIHQSHFTVLKGFGKVTFRSQKYPDKVTLSSQVTLQVIKRRLKVFCWSCDEGHLKWDKKNSRASSSSVRIEWAYSRLLVLMVGPYLLDKKNLGKDAKREKNSCRFYAFNFFSGALLWPASMTLKSA